jgi:hypothetical protein
MGNASLTMVVVRADAQLKPTPIAKAFAETVLWAPVKPVRGMRASLQILAMIQRLAPKTFSREAPRLAMQPAVTWRSLPASVTMVVVRRGVMNLTTLIVRQVLLVAMVF